MSTSTSVLLDIERIAGDLAVSQVEVKRLIATKRLPATRLGEDGPYRVTVADFEAFVKSGAPGLRLAEFDPLRPAWFADSYRYLADSFDGAIRTAAADQVPSDEQLRRDFEARPRETTIDYPIRATGAVAEVVNRAVPNAMFGDTPTGEADTRFATWGDLYAVQKLRDTALQVIRDRDIGAAGFDALFDSPESFAAITGDAYAGASTRRIVWSKTLMLSGGPFGEIPQERRASFLLPLSIVFPPTAKARLIGLAF